MHSQPSLRSVAPSPHTLASFSNQPVAFLFDQALHRLLLYYSGDTFVLLACLAKCTRAEATRLLLSAIQTAAPLPTPIATRLSLLGKAYAFLTDDARCLAVFREKELVLRWRRPPARLLPGDRADAARRLLQCLPEIVQQRKCG